MNTRIEQMAYSEAYDIGLGDAFAHRLPRHRAPRSASASAGRFGYSDGFSDGLQRRKGLDSRVTRSALERRAVIAAIRQRMADTGIHPVGRIKRAIDEIEEETA